MLYQCIRIVSRLIAWLPLRTSLALGQGLGRLCWLLVPGKRKRMATANIERSLALKPAAAAAIARASAVRFGPMFMEVLRLPYLNSQNIHQVVRLEGAEHLEAALAEGHGVVLATAHSGNWELLGAALAMHGFPLVAVVQKQTNAEMDRFINDYRRGAGMHVTYKSGVREMVKLLSEGRIVGLLMDQDSDTDGVFVEFFGRIASTPPGAAALARLKGAPIVPAFITANGDGTHTALIHPAIHLERTSSRESDIFTTTQQLTRIIEDHIRQRPEEWFWLHNRWKHQPPTERQP